MPPVLLASNHPNALVDALVVGCTTCPGRWSSQRRQRCSRIRSHDCDPDGPYLRFRRDANIHQRLYEDLAWLRGEVIALDTLIATTPN